MTSEERWARWQARERRRLARELEEERRIAAHVERRHARRRAAGEHIPFFERGDRGPFDWGSVAGFAAYIYVFAPLFVSIGFAILGDEDQLDYGSVGMLATAAFVLWAGLDYQKGVQSRRNGTRAKKAP